MVAVTPNPPDADPRKFTIFFILCIFGQRSIICLQLKQEKKSLFKYNKEKNLNSGPRYSLNMEGEDKIDVNDTKHHLSKAQKLWIFTQGIGHVCIQCKLNNVHIYLCKCRKFQSDSYDYRNRPKKIP